ncbi:PREDICTED: alpha-aminoadipic semialdehyde synthase, mitochondrial-like [Amphimedon queenslandica]|uniref:Saccharopine dehydrogenase n=1 Tax=Amphimedon queenslandica TaxID=400682 RepID=A0A1X7VBR8_AMPQE|nr:PREDICTED: alpha-aminoadipic semialdehyde synthase, mitochondrial-like [Amphimedon queenslandica]|eukprot:XP_019849717.1 PREDICTED: alpha-aminoadipic semialdehyde synthase, mitochondrial-like [Amphimedon queenslandica]
MQRVLLLGSGRTCPPLVELLTRDKCVQVTVASNDASQAESMARSYPNTTAKHFNLSPDSDLSQLIKDHDLVMSLVPTTLHTIVARQCIDAKTNLVTASYVSPELASLHDSAQEAGVVIMNECGLDPGIDHLLAMDCIDNVHKNNGKILYFESWCGGLPHSSFAGNPLRYKFSWSPAGVLIAACNPARYLKGGKVVEIPAGGGIMREVKPMSNGFSTSLPLEGYPNRDSLKYRDLYGIQEAETVIRGTLRYQGYCKSVLALLELGLLDNETMPRLQPDAADITWSDLLAMLLSRTEVRGSNLKESVLEALQGDKEKYQIIQDLGLLSSTPVSLAGTPLRALASHLETMLELGPDEYDTVLLQHIVGIENSNSTKEEHCITLHMDGDKNGDTAMSKLVGKTAAIAAKIILSGQYKRKGVQRPLTPDIYEPALKALQDEGVHYDISVKKM